MNFLISGNRLELTLRYGVYIPTAEDALTADETLLRLVESLGMEKIKRKKDESLQSQPVKIAKKEKCLDKDVENLDVLRVLQKLDEAKSADIDDEFTRIISDLRKLVYTASDEKKRSILSILSDLK